MSTFETDIRPPHDPESCTRAGCGRCRPKGKANVPPIPTTGENGGIGPHDVETPPPPPDRAVASIGRVKHSPPSKLAEIARDFARLMDDQGLDIFDRLHHLSDDGYPGATLGDGGSRGTDSPSQPERFVLRNPGPWHGKDREFHADLRRLEDLLVDVKATMLNVLRHASTDDPTPAGTGECRACARYCKPSEGKAGNRLRSGMCPTCYRAWKRYSDGGGELIRVEWIAQRLASFTERYEDGTVKQIHTPEPDHDIDLSTERWADVTPPEEDGNDG